MSLLTGVKKVAIAGASMEPTLKEGDWLLFRYWRAGLKAELLGPKGMAEEAKRGRVPKEFHARIARKAESLEGKVVLFERSEQPGLIQVKRVKRILQSTNGEFVFWVEGDNAAASADSRAWGGVSLSEIRGVALFRYRKSR